MGNYSNIDIDSAMSAAVQRRDSRNLSRLSKIYLANLEIYETREQANRLRNAALYYVYHFRSHGRQGVLDKAKSLARAAYDVYADEADPFARAKLLDTLANIAYLQGRNENAPDALEEAQTIYAQALTLLDPKTDGAAWCTVANSLASVHASRHRRDGDPAHRQSAEALYRRVRSIACRNKLAQTWLDAGGNILRMTRDSAAGAGDHKRLLSVINSLRRMRRFLEARREEIQWNDFRHLLANTLCDASKIHYDRLALEEAASLLRTTLAEVTAEKAEADWASLTFDLASILSLIGDREMETAALVDARELLSSIADFPSQRRAKRGRRPLWSTKSTVEFYARAVVAVRPIRGRLAALSRTVAPLYENEHDIADLIAKHQFGDRGLEATIRDTRATNGLDLALATRDLRRLEEAEAHSRTAAAVYISLDQTSSAAHVLTRLGQALMKWARAPDPFPWFERAENIAREAASAAGDDSLAEAAVDAWCLGIYARLRAAAWRNDIVVVGSLRDEVEHRLLQAGSRISRAQDVAFRWLAAEAGSAFARLRNMPDFHERMFVEMTALGAHTDLSGPQSGPSHFKIGPGVWRGKLRSIRLA